MVELNDHLYEAPEESPEESPEKSSKKSPEEVSEEKAPEEEEEPYYGPEIKSHQGFTKRAKKWMEVLVPKMKNYKKKVICTTNWSFSWGSYIWHGSYSAEHRI